MGDVLADARYALRILVRNPAFTAFAVIAMTLGIGCATAVFSFVDAVLLRPLPYANPERLVTLWETEPEVNWAPVTMQDFVAWKQQTSVFSDLIAYEIDVLTLSGVRHPRPLLASRISPELFRMLGVPALLGRTLGPADDRPNSEPVAIISERLWKTQFGSDPAVIGKPVNLSRKLYTVAGVMPARFQSPRKQTDVWLPIITQTELSKPPSHYLRVIARLKDGIASERAHAEMNVIATRLALQFPESNTGVGVKIVPLLDVLHEEIGPVLRILSVAAGLLLLIACVNVSGLLLVRMVNRQQEVALRMAAGAGRRRLIRQLLVESVVLALAGSIPGLLLAPWLIRSLLVLFPERIAAYVPNLENVAVDGRVLACSLAVSVITGVLFGLAPAWRASRMNINESLKSVSFRGAGGRRQRRAQGFLVSAEFALSLMLLIAAGLLLRSFLLLENRGLGFTPDHVVTFYAGLPESAYRTGPEVTAFYQRLLREASTLPGVRLAAAISNLPLGGSNSDTEFRIEGTSQPRPGQEILTQYSVASPGYFRTMGIALLSGREFLETDGLSAPRVAIVSESTARRFWRRGEALGKRIALGGSDETVRIVGIAKDVRWHEFDNEPVTSLYTYVPCAQDPHRMLSVVLRTTAAPADVAAALRSLGGSESEEPSRHLLTMDDLVARANAPRRFNMLLMNAFALFALLLTGTGVYGAVAHSISSRKRELGIRIALGAGRSDVLCLLVGQAIRLAAGGAGAGLLCALLARRVVASLLYGVSPGDPLTIGSSVAIIVLTAGLASGIPAMRAMAFSPAKVLREE